MVSELAREYLTEYPNEAANAVEKLKRKDLTELIVRLNPELRARLITHLLPSIAIDCLGELPLDMAADVIERLPHTAAARLLAGVRQADRRAILEALPLAHSQALQHALRYPEDSIGTIMLSDSPCCRGDASVREAKRLVRRYRADVTPSLTVLDNAQRPLGLIDIGQLLRLRERSVISEAMRAVPARLRARARIETVINHRAWTTVDYLPVVETDDSFVGLLPKTAVYAYALDQDPARRTEGHIAETLVALADLVWRPGAEILARATSPEPGESV